MTNHAVNGRAREHRVRDRMTQAGWTPVMRSAGSRGSGDLLMGHPVHGGALVQVKPRDGQIGPADRIRLVDHAELVCCLPILAVVRQGIPIRFWRVTYGKPASWEPWSPWTP